MNLEQRNEELNKKIDQSDLNKAVATLVRDAHRRRRQIVLLTISIAFDFFLTFALAYGWKLNHGLAIKAETNRMAIIRRCEATNAGRANNKELWDYILAQPPAEPRTPAQQEAVDKFAKKVNETFAPDDCNKVVSEPK